MAGITLLIRADEFGLYHAANQAIEEGFETGLLTCATLVGCGSWLREAVALIHAHSQWEVGLEVRLDCTATGCSWGPVSGRSLVPSLVTRAGDFPSRLIEHATPEDIRQEFDAQINRVLKYGIRPAFLECDSDSPLVEQALAEFSGVYGIPARMASFGFRPFDPASSLFEEGAYLWVVRPAQDTPETWGMWSEPGSHVSDARAVCDPELAARLAGLSVRCCTFGEYLQTLT
jgi:predicted glycoside hydrolase/deacetylase ChbG (UPF0249 family)